MAHSHILTGLILQTHDVGEADRFCILLTEERGKIAARARGVRKLKSRMGGTLLPLRRVVLTIHEGSTGFLITGAELQKDFSNAISLPTLLCMQQIVEILLTILEDNHPVPEITAITFQELAALRTGVSLTSLPFLIHLLLHMGVLPMDTRHALFTHLSADERNFLNSCFANETTREMTHCETLRMLCHRILDEQLHRSLKTMQAKDVYEEMKVL